MSPSTFRLAFEPSQSTTGGDPRPISCQGTRQKRARHKIAIRHRGTAARMARHASRKFEIASFQGMTHCAEAMQGFLIGFASQSQFANSLIVL